MMCVNCVVRQPDLSALSNWAHCGWLIVAGEYHPKPLNSSLPGVIWIGDTKKVVGEIFPCSFIDVTLDLLPIKSGVWEIGELHIENLLTNKKFSYGTIGQILVGLD